MAVTEEPILSRLDRLDNMLRELEEIRGSCNRSPKSSCESTASSGTLAKKHCRPINRVMMETEIKGTLVEGLDHAEERLLKLCIQLEDELEAEKKREEKTDKSEKKGLKGLLLKTWLRERTTIKQRIEVFFIFFL
ncbi:hypothetical protein P3X46_013133 [Hevea brasiliensis]|uniref:Rx N-terminal domain-containing protein n=1 Tax=Hevea brasiliensis TaxID=3981 RepID=A0ABQ9M2J5_HEVBR|nr:hypothetical protein P3X46_013133 [Hevea brasiliensis]